LKRVCIDPGHQSTADMVLEPVAPGAKRFKPRCAPGTRGLRTGVPEYELTLQIALATEKYLATRGIDVVLIRRSSNVQISNRERAEFANDSGAELCVKLHCNGVRTILWRLARWRRGFSTLVPAPGTGVANIHDVSLRFARITHAHVLRATGFPDRGIEFRHDLTGFNWSRIPVFLLEIGFLTNPTEEALLVDAVFQARVAEGIADGVLEGVGRV
jgi:N-acetylmuramoyl-L-alanine amidase